MMKKDDLKIDTKRMFKLENNSQDQFFLNFSILSVFNFIFFWICYVIPLPGNLCPVLLSFSLVFLSAQRSLQTDPAPSCSHDCTSWALHYNGATSSTASKKYTREQ